MVPMRVVSRVAVALVTGVAGLVLSQPATASPASVELVALSAMPYSAAIGTGSPTTGPGGGPGGGDGSDPTPDIGQGPRGSHTDSGSNGSSGVSGSGGPTTSTGVMDSVQETLTAAFRWLGGLFGSSDSAAQQAGAGQPLPQDAASSTGERSSGCSELQRSARGHVPNSSGSSKSSGSDTGPPPVDGFCADRWGTPADNAQPTVR